MCGGRCLFVTGLSVLLLAYYLYAPIPEGVKSPTQWRLSMATVRLVLKTLDLVEFLGLGNKWAIAKSMSSEKNTPKQQSDDQIKMSDTTFDGVNVRLYEPIGATPGGPAIVYLHGGGWMIGSSYMADVYVRRLVEKLNVVVASVNYRMAPEHIFPVPFEDCLKASKYFLANAKQYKVNPNWIALAGDSAGGNLAAAISLKLRDEKFYPRPKLQVLIYPTLQGIDFLTPSMQGHQHGAMLTRELMAEFVANYISGSSQLTATLLQNNHTTAPVKASLASTYLNHDSIDGKYKSRDYVKPRLDYGDAEIWKKVQGALLNPYCMPLMAQDLNDLPATLVYTVGQDVLRDDGIWYAQRLKEAGNDVTHHHFGPAAHGLLSFVNVLEEAEFVSDNIVDYIKRKL